MAGEAANSKKTGPGRAVHKVALVGAGPGDPELLTLRAARLIGEADIVFADRLVGKGVMDLIPASAETVYVGKSKGEHSVPQEEIHRRMIEAARSGKRVVRLKGGDPFVFGRGGEEVEALRAAGIEVEVVPGISAALGIAAATQIPLTHRDMAQAVTFVTGHAALGKEPDLDWRSLARPNQTVVVFMGVGTADAIAARLIAAGRDPATPVAVVENGTRPNEVRAYGRLGEVSELIQSRGINGPALLIIGEVAALAQREEAAGGEGAKAKPTLSSLWEMLS
jgi:uroporphyrin-III C-methyltransferase/precorrin-2 dehydrogenase/sirohydrochlorin ferrochelatase